MRRIRNSHVPGYLSSVDVSKLIRLCTLSNSKLIRELGRGLTAHRIALYISGYLIPAYSVQPNPYCHEEFTLLDMFADVEISKRLCDANRGVLIPRI